MKNYRYYILSMVLTVWLSLTVGMALAADNDFPDLLGEDMEDAGDVDGAAELVISDPLEPMNRVFFEFNDVLYEWVLRPVADGYSWVFPFELRDAFGNFFTNLAMPVRLVNSILQGDVEKSGIVLGRFLINSTLGVYGFADVADKEFGLEPKKGDFDQTLGKWGLGTGIYFNWPVFGPSSVRGTFGLVADSYSHPIPYLSDSTGFSVAYSATERINFLSLYPEVYEDLKKFSLDPYVASRDAYYEYRNAVILGD